MIHNQLNQMLTKSQLLLAFNPMESCHTLVSLQHLCCDYTNSWHLLSLAVAISAVVISTQFTLKSSSAVRWVSSAVH